LVAGKIDGIGMTLDNLALLRARGVLAKAIFKYDDSYGADGVVARRTISALSDLKGRSVAWSPGTPSHFFLVQALRTVGLSTKDLNHISMSPDDAGAAFAAGKLDGAVTWEPWLSKAQSSGIGHVLISTRELSVVNDVLFLREDSLKRRDQQITAMLRACFRALDYWKNNKADGDAITARGVGLQLPELQSMLSGIRIVDLAGNKAFFGTPSQPGPAYDAFKLAVNSWISEGVMKQSISPNDAIDPTYLQAIH
jgi:NitT/TauT family transport system substrate-binding protein